MRILVLTKRQYTGKDLLDDQYGRLYEIPKHLALKNNLVVGLCFSYQKRREGLIQGSIVDRSPVDWHSVNLGWSVIPGLLRYNKIFNRLVDEFDPQLLIACSDAFHAIAGVKAAKKLNIPCVVDLYDNFESFGATRIPGVTSMFREAVKNADGLICVSNSLNEHIHKTCNPRGAIKTVVNGVCRELFRPLDKYQCRQKLGLPIDSNIIGTAGAISHSRGVNTLFEGFAKLSKKDNKIHLVIAGPVAKNVILPTGKRIHYLGNLNQTEIPLLLNTFDVAVICNRDTPFGRYCFPQKAYEIIACNIPVVAACVGSLAELFKNHSECLYDPDDANSLTAAVIKQLHNPTRVNIAIPTWAELALEVEKLLYEVETSSLLKPK